MARLSVDEGGQVRRFRLKDGRLSIGSGASAALRLEQAGLAELHAHLVVRAGEATLELAGGQDAGRTFRLEDGVPFELGSATLTVEADEPEPAAAAAPLPKVSRAPRGGSAARSPRAGRSPRVAKKRGGPWLILIVIALLAGGGWKVFESYAQYAGERGFDVQTSYNRVTSRLDERDYAGALREYAKIDAQTDLDPKWRATFDDLRTRALALKEEAQRAARDVRWSQDYLQPQLQKFEREYLKGTPDPSRVRVFLKRIRFFKENCPGHPEMDWVDRMEERYARIVNLDDPPSYEDIAFEVESLTWAKPRDYKRAFEVLDEYLDGATGEDRARALSLFDELSVARQAHFEDRLAQAKYDWDKGRQGEAIMWLAHLIVYSGDETMANDAARRLVQFPDIDAYLRGYAQTQPAIWADLVQHPAVARKAAEIGLEPEP